MKDLNNPSNWKYESPEEEGFWEVVTPENSACKISWIYRLNLAKNSQYLLRKDKLELNGALIAGKAQLSHNGNSYELVKFDSFYLPGKENLIITAKEACSIFIGGGIFEKKGTFFTRKFDLGLPLGDIHQIHGKTPYRREVFMTVAQQDEASSLICGITLGEPGKWTSWPPHQHSKDLEEVYCFFNIPKPQSAFHYASRKSGEFEYIHPVSSGDCVIIPEGYHPTSGMPGVKSCYFWIMTAYSPKSRRYDLAVNDPSFD